MAYRRSSASSSNRKKYHQTITKQQQAKHGFDRPEHAARSKSRETPAKRIQIERESRKHGDKNAARREQREEEHA
jgi:hypothetical protein